MEAVPALNVLAGPAEARSTAAAAWSCRRRRARLPDDAARSSRRESSTAAAWMLCAAGSASSTSRVNTVCFVTLCTSTSGEAPDTVIVSSSAPTLRSALTVAVKLPVSSIALALERAEARQRERHGVDAGAEADDPILTRRRRSTADRVFSMSAGLLAFDGDARQHRAAVVPDRSGDGLRGRRRSRQPRSAHPPTRTGIRRFMDSAPRWLDRGGRHPRSEHLAGQRLRGSRRWSRRNYGFSRRGRNRRGFRLLGPLPKNQDLALPLHPRRRRRTRA